MLKLEASLPKSSLELSNDRVRQLGELVERFNNLPVCEIAGFAQAYLRGEINLGLLCRVFGEETNYGFVFSAQPSRRHRGKVVNGTTPTGDGKDARPDFNCQQPLMLSHNVELMERVKEVIPSFVRFQMFDDRSFFNGKGLYEFVPFVVSAHELFGAVSNGKVSVINKRLAVAVSQHRSENIEAASDSIDVSARLNLERERERGFWARHNDIVQGVCWQLFDHYVNVVVEPSIEARLKDWELGYGPMDRGLSMKQVIGHNGGKA